jgi:folate-binding protein YgfZ
VEVKVADSEQTIRTWHEEYGVRWAEVSGADGIVRRVPRNYGDPAAEYVAARERAIVVDRLDRAFVRVYGRDPIKMIQGLVTNDVAGAPPDQGVYAVLLSPKGKMLADVRVFRQGSDILLDSDVAAQANVCSTLTKFVPPLFARFQDMSNEQHMLGVYGPSARDIVEKLLGAVPARDSREDTFVVVDRAGQASMCVRTLYTGDEGFDLSVPAHLSASLFQELIAAGAQPAGHATLDVLRIENSRPIWGAELGEDVIPLEAGLAERAISQTKGCYTGQEVIVRILHRGHVNRHLRGVRMGEEPVPARGTELFQADGKKVGVITSACVSPRHAETIGLAYVRREIVPPATVRLGRHDGSEVRVVTLPF